MLKKKSAIFALIAVLMFAAAMFFMWKETKETYDNGDFENDTEPEPEETEYYEPEPEPVSTVVRPTKTPDNDKEPEKQPE